MSNEFEWPINFPDVSEMKERGNGRTWLCHTARLSADCSELREEE